MTFLTVTISCYSVPYNGHVTIVQTRKRGRVIDRYVQWRDTEQGEVTKEVIAPLKVSKVDLIRAIYWMGTSVVGRSNERLAREARRPGSRFLRLSESKALHERIVLES